MTTPATSTETVGASRTITITLTDAEHTMLVCGVPAWRERLACELAAHDQHVRVGEEPYIDAEERAWRDDHLRLALPLVDRLHLAWAEAAA